MIVQADQFGGWFIGKNVWSVANLWCRTKHYKHPFFFFFLLNYKHPFGYTWIFPLHIIYIQIIWKLDFRIIYFLLKIKKVVKNVSYFFIFFIKNYLKWFTKMWRENKILLNFIFNVGRKYFHKFYLIFIFNFLSKSIKLFLVFIWQKLFLSTYFTIQFIFLTIHESYCNFWYYL